jgi:hypothetical protein
MTRKQTKGDYINVWSERQDKADLRKLCEQSEGNKDSKTSNGDSRQAA